VGGRTWQTCPIDQTAHQGTRPSGQPGAPGQFGVLVPAGLLVAVPAAVLVPVGATGGVLLRDIALFAVAAIALPLVTAVGGLLYVDQRIRREGFDLALPAQTG
jgi:hypothetical protein